MSGYGKDLYCFDRLFTGRFAAGTDLLAQAAYRRLTTARGTLDDGEEGQVYGIDIADFIGRVGDAAAVDTLAPLVSAELLKDDRFAEVDARATADTNSAGETSITLDINITPVDAAESFTLSLAVSAVSVEVLGVTS